MTDEKKKKSRWFSKIWASIRSVQATFKLHKLATESAKSLVRG